MPSVLIGRPHAGVAEALRRPRAARPTPATAWVRRFEDGQSSSTVPRSTSFRITSSLRAAAMPWPMRSGWSFSSTAQHAVGAGVRGLAGVDGGAEAGRARAREQLAVAVDVAAELERVLLGAGEVDADHAAVPVLLGLLHDDLVQLVVELAREAEDQPGADAVVEAGALHARAGRRG